MNRITDRPPTLADHAHRPIRAFLGDPKIRDSALENAFFDVVYTGHDEVDAATAATVVLELEMSGRRVGEVLDGTWKPEALGGKS